jgi:hypothetical protein
MTIPVKTNIRLIREEQAILDGKEGVTLLLEPKVW